MLSKEEMVKLLAEKYNIHSERELEKALEKTAINLSIFTKQTSEVKHESRNLSVVS